MSSLCTINIKSSNIKFSHIKSLNAGVPGAAEDEFMQRAVLLVGTALAMCAAPKARSLDTAELTFLMELPASEFRFYFRQFVDASGAAWYPLPVLRKIAGNTDCRVSLTSLSHQPCWLCGQRFLPLGPEQTCLRLLSDILSTAQPCLVFFSGCCPVLSFFKGINIDNKEQTFLPFCLHGRA